LTTPIRALVAALVLLASGTLSGCASKDDTEIISAVLRSGETFHRDFAYMDEDGATIVEQAQHFLVSEVRRNASTQWAARYVYEPAPGFVGNDRVELEVRTGAESATDLGRVRRVSIRFSIEE